ncbi:MAG TPA: HU family DNA-binding protein [Desulfohalobiaceae bacterium]|nr:HU family DNA-binding protein [Desulfohalobiaceae bacterium]
MSTKSELIRKIAEESKLTKAASEKFLNACLDTIKEEMGNGGKLNLTGFGSLSIVNRKERLGRNPQTGEKMYISARKAVKFSPGKALKEKISGQ